MITDVPFNKNGDQLHYEGDSYPPIWKDNFEFDDVLVFKGMHRGRSAAYFAFTRKSNGKTVTVFMRDAIDMFPYMVRGEVVGKFTFCKRGQNYGCRVVKP